MFGGVGGKDALPDILQMLAEGQPVAARDRPPHPVAEVDYLSEVFGELSLSRQAGFNACPILYQEIEAWQRLTGRRLRPWWMRLIKAIDAAFLRAAAASAARK
jgi:hypothetical protein